MNAALETSINTLLDCLVRPSVWLFHRQRTLFRICGYVGLITAILLSLGLTLAQNLSVWVMIVLILASIVSFFAIALLRKVLTGREALTYYHHEIGVIVTVWVVLRLIQQPVLPFLDVTILGVGAFLVFGRMGCLMAGCCYGRPNQWGVCYHEAHIQAGFPSYLENVRLLPIQLVESLWVLFIVLFGTLSILTAPLQHPGSVFAWYVVMYDIGRFFIELARGDAIRPYFKGLSENQWVSLILTGMVIVGELSGGLPFEVWHVCGFIFIAGTTVILIVLSSLSSRDNYLQLMSSAHIREIALVLEGLRDELNSMEVERLTPSYIPVKQTSCGLRISMTSIIDFSNLENTTHYAISRTTPPLSPKSAQALMRLIQQLTRSDPWVTLITVRESKA